MNALGYSLAPNIVVAGTRWEAIQGGAPVALLSGQPATTDSTSATLSSATIKVTDGNGNPVPGDELYVNGVQGGSIGNGVTASWNANASTLTLTGVATVATYDTLLGEFAYQDAGTDTSSATHPQRTVIWNVNDGTNSFSTTSQVTIDRPPFANNDVAPDVAGATITATAVVGVVSNDSDLDGDGLTVIGVSDAANGAGSVGQSFAGVYGHLTLNANGSYSYVADNLPAIDGAAAGSHPVDGFTYTESDGNGGTAQGALAITIDRLPVVTASNVTLGAALVAASSLFTASDPDGYAIATYGFMNSGRGHLVFNGVAQWNNQEIDVTAAQLSQLTYQSAAQATDTLQVAASDGTLWSNWVSFAVTAPPLVIEAQGSTSLVQVANNYFLFPVGGSSGPELSYNGAPFVAGQSGAWAPIGAEKTATGYEIAWQVPGTDQYAVWNTDSSGNYQSTDRRRVRKQRGVAIGRIHFPPGPQWRRRDRSPHDGDRGARIDQPG